METNILLFGVQSVEAYNLDDPGAKPVYVQLKNVLGRNVQLAVNHDSVVRSDSMGSLTDPDADSLPKLEIAPISDVVDDGKTDWQRVSCGDGAQMYPGIAPRSDRVVWEESRGSSDVVTRAAPARSCTG